MKPLNNRPSVIKVRTNNVDEISDVLTKEDGTHSVIVKNEYGITVLSNNHGFNKRTPVLNGGGISKPKLAILKLFDDSVPDLHLPNGRNDSYQTRGAETHATSTSSSAESYSRSTSSSAESFSTSSSAGSFSTSSSSISPSTYPVNLKPRIIKKESLAMKNAQCPQQSQYHSEQFHQPSQYHPEQFQQQSQYHPEQFHQQSQYHSEQHLSLIDSPVREWSFPVGSGISWNDYPFQSEKTEDNDSNNNIAHREFKFVGSNSNRFLLNSSFSEKASADHGNIMACGIAGCGKTFSKRVHLNAHIRVHNGDKPFKCSWRDCGKAFTRQGELKRHNWVHTKPERFYCDNCVKKFSRADHLKMHKSKCKYLAWSTSAV